MSMLRTFLLQIRHRPRLAVATMAGALTFLALPDHLPRITNGLLAWDVGVGLYLVLALVMMGYRKKQTPFSPNWEGSVGAVSCQSRESSVKT